MGGNRGRGEALRHPLIQKGLVTISVTITSKMITLPHV
jgi:hypothetical protein